MVRDLGDPLTVSEAHPGPASQAILFPVNMGNRGQNELSVRDTFVELARASTKCQFLAYHWRKSGNFVFEFTDESAISEAIEIGKQVTTLECIVRRLSDLRVVNAAVPTDARIARGSVVLETTSGVRRVIYVALSESVAGSLQTNGALSKRIEISS